MDTSFPFSTWPLPWLAWASSQLGSLGVACTLVSSVVVDFPERVSRDPGGTYKLLTTGLGVWWHHLYDISQNQVSPGQGAGTPPGNKCWGVHWEPPFSSAFLHLCDSSSSSSVPLWIHLCPALYCWSSLSSPVFSSTCSPLMALISCPWLLCL